MYLDQEFRLQAGCGSFCPLLFQELSSCRIVFGCAELLAEHPLTVLPVDKEGVGCVHPLLPEHTGMRLCAGGIDLPAGRIRSLRHSPFFPLFSQIREQRAHAGLQVKIPAAVRSAFLPILGYIRCIRRGAEIPCLILCFKKKGKCLSGCVTSGLLCGTGIREEPEEESLLVFSRDSPQRKGHLQAAGIRSGRTGRNRPCIGINDLLTGADKNPLLANQTDLLRKCHGESIHSGQGCGKQLCRAKAGRNGTRVAWCGNGSPVHKSAGQNGFGNLQAPLFPCIFYDDGLVAGKKRHGARCKPFVQWFVESGNCCLLNDIGGKSLQMFQPDLFPGAG